MYIVGIDPGLKGGIAFYTPTNLEAHRTPTLTRNFVKKGKKASRQDMDLEKTRELLQGIDIECAFLEQVSAMPGQGVTSMFRFGQNLGQWQGLLTGIGIRYILVKPQVWKKKIGLIGSNKIDSVELARKIWPEHDETFKYKTSDEGRAEASLIAKYGWESIHENTN